MSDFSRRENPAGPSSLREDNGASAAADSDGDGDDMSGDGGSNDDAASDSSSSSSVKPVAPGGVRNPSIALPREHSYLGESHPLLPDADRNNRGVGVGSSYVGSGGPGKTTSKEQHQRHRKCGNSSSVTTNVHELAILELYGVVLFPGSTIPVKLSNRSMIGYLRKQIRLSRTDPVSQPRVLVGILPYGSQKSWMPSPSRSSRRHRSRNEAGDDDRRDGRRGPSRRRQRRSSTSASVGHPPLRGSWMRQRFSFGNAEIRSTASSHRLRQSLTRLRDEFQFADFDSEDGTEHNNNDDDDDSNNDTGWNYLDDDADDDNNNNDNNNGLPLSRQQQQPQSLTSRRHPLVGRIGTIATVQNTHERTAVNRSSGSNIMLNEESNELAFTAVGTSRFRIVSCINEDECIYEVEELVESSFPRPPFSSRSLSFAGADCKPATSSNNLTTLHSDPKAHLRSAKIPTPSQRISRNLSLLTPFPYNMYQHLTPWSLVEKIAAALRSNNGKGNFPSLGDDSFVSNAKKLEPMAFSYWIANNAPFSEEDRIKLLKMDSVLERLLFVWEAVKRLTANSSESRVCCLPCRTYLSDVSEIFVVGGAEATTSAYVNGHGFIHQITTLREVDEDQLNFRDRPSTENSYFPGYSWHITSCKRCGSQLGWKFRKVVDDECDEDGSEWIDRDTLGRPPYFYGFMTANVKVYSLDTAPT